MNAYYSGKHWAQRKQDAEYWHMLALSAMNKAKVRRQPFDVPVMVRFGWNDKLDIDNHAVIGKCIVDAMKKRIIYDDSRKYLVEVDHYFHTGDYIQVDIIETVPSAHM